MRNVRIFFEKTALAKYISHLDLMRCFSRSIKRAGINIWYTEGYNPHPFMTFAMPLSLGTESYCESVDIRTTDEMPFEEIKERLNSALPVDIKISKVCEPVHKADEICFAEFSIIFYTDNTQAVLAEIEKCLSADEILVEKKAKQGRKKVFKQIDIKENIKSAQLSMADGTVILNTVLTAGNKGNINPSLLIDKVSANVKDRIECTDIIKKKMFLSDMTEFC